MHRSLLSLLLCVVTPHVASQAIFRCVGTDGGLMLQQGPCHGGQDLGPRKVLAQTVVQPTAGPVPRPLPVRPSAVDRTTPVAVARR